MYLDGQEAVKQLKKSAEQGDELSMFRLGKIYVERAIYSKKDYPKESYRKDIDKAIKWFKKASEFESIGNFAQFNLGWIFAHITPDHLDIRESAKWLRKASRNGNKDADAALWYLHGHYVEELD